MDEKQTSFQCWLAGVATNTGMDFGILLLRLGVGGMMLVHGIPKLLMLLQGNWTEFPNPLGTGSFIALLLCVGAEVFCSVLLILGLFTRPAALLLVINMSVALFYVMGLSGWGTQEPAALYLLIYICLFYAGPGRFSLDAVWLRRSCKVELE